MAENIYRESGTESYAGKIAVGHVVLNRVKNQKYPRTICGVIYEGSQSVHTSTCQFSWTCESTLSPIVKSSPLWAESSRAAKELLTANNLIDITDGALNY
jgi:spore germination cell wall hydrolase CwlJ-like protein